MRITDAPIDASVSTRTPPPLPYVLPPPPITLPPVPAAFVVAPSARARGQLPRRGELAFVPEAEAEVARLKDYVGIFGKTVPSQAAVTQALDSAFQWSTFRAALAAWEAYAQAQEVDAWLDVRAVLSRLKPALALAVVTDASIGQVRVSPIVTIHSARS